MTLALVAAEGQAAIRHHQQVAGVLDRARRSVVTKSIVRAGGGIVWRRGRGGGVEIVLVHRSGYDDWSFPKGELQAGETEAQAALREVQEETRLWCRLGREVGTSAHRDPKATTQDRALLGDDPDRRHPQGGPEIDDARWVPLGEAPGLLTHDHDRRLLEGWQPAG